MPPFPDAVLTMERTITVKGPSIEVVSTLFYIVVTLLFLAAVVTAPAFMITSEFIFKVSAAEQKISARLRQSYETDLQHRVSLLKNSSCMLLLTTVCTSSLDVFSWYPYHARHDSSNRRCLRCFGCIHYATNGRSYVWYWRAYRYPKDHSDVGA